MRAVGVIAGGRLEFVVQQLPGTVKRPVVKWTKKDGLKTVLKDQPAGFMVYFPRGHVVRFKDKAALAHYGLDREPRLANLSGLSDPNSLVGKMFSSQDDDIRKGAFADLEKHVMHLATVKTGPLVTPEMVEGRYGAAAAA